MIINNFDTEKSIYIIAEIGNNHEGSYNLAQEMIGLAAEAGANAVKFQTFIPELFVNSIDTKRMEQMKNFALSFDEFKSLATFAKESTIDFISTPLDIESAMFLNSIQPVFKIASGDNTFYPLLDKVSEFGKPIIISTGLAKIDTIQQTTDYIHDKWNEKAISSELALLHCVTSYPVPFEYANIKMIHRYKYLFPDITIGYSDHTLGIKASVAAAAAGARIIEKHFTIDKNHSEFRDHQISADSDEMLIMIDSIRDTEVIMGNSYVEIQPIEEEFSVTARRSIAAKRDIKKGSTLSLDDLMWVRPGTGIKPGDESKVIGRRTNCNIQRGDLIDLNILQE